MKKLVLALFVVSALAACKKDEAPAVDAQPATTEAAPADGTAPTEGAPAAAPADGAAAPAETPAAH